MDPFSALSLASNICQLLDFGGRLVSGSLEFYRSGNRASSVHGELEFIVDDLVDMCGALTQSESRIDQQHATKSELALIPLAQSCKELGDEFLSVLNSLKVKARHQKIASVCQALKSEWKRKTIQGYERRLKSYRSQITLHLLMILR